MDQTTEHQEEDYPTQAFQSFSPLLTEHHLEFLSLKGGFTGSSESTLVKMPLFWKSHVTAQLDDTVKLQRLEHQ